jgi:hypothetical protein
VRGTLLILHSVVYRDVTRQAKGLYCLKHAGARRSGLTYLSQCNSSWFCHTCHDSLDPLFQNLGIWIQGSGAAGHVSSATYFSNLKEDKDRRLKIKLTLSLILRVNLRLGGYSIWSASLIAPHIKKIGHLHGV